MQLRAALRNDGWEFGYCSQSRKGAKVLFVIARPRHELKLLFIYVAEAISASGLCKFQIASAHVLHYVQLRAALRNDGEFVYCSQRWREFFSRKGAKAQRFCSSLRSHGTN
jgi:hypothetical protein